MKKLVTEVEKIIKPISTSDGAGVKLKRSVLCSLFRTKTRVLK